jgi:hemerythrin-like domain-containing protein
MSGHDPIKMLTHEHEVILKVIGGLGKIGRALERGERADPETLRRIVRFMREFADRCHHAKEEELLFPALVSKGAPAAGCPIGGLREEHGKGRKLVTALAEAVDKYAASPGAGGRDIATIAKEIGDLYTNHIWKENEMVFPMASRLFSDAEREQLFEKFEAAEHEIGANHEELAAFAAELSR